MAAQQAPGTLYMVATPIGNLADMGPRALDTLQTVDLIAAEDTRRTRKLLAHFGLHTPLESFHGDSDARKLVRLVRRLQEGASIACVSDGGTPGISDPGAELAAAAAQAGCRVIPIPGPSAVTAALSVAGFPAGRFHFAGFIPPRGLAEALPPLLGLGCTLVLYESPHRLRDTMAVLAGLAPNRPLVVGREVTKQYEEWHRGTIAEVAVRLSGVEPRGEYVLVIGPGEPAAAPAHGAVDLDAVLRRLLAAGLSVRDAAAIVADLGAASRHEAYQRALGLRKEDEGAEAK